MIISHLFDFYSVLPLTQTATESSTLELGVATVCGNPQIMGLLGRKLLLSQVLVRINIFPWGGMKLINHQERMSLTRRTLRAITSQFWYL